MSDADSAKTLLGHTIDSRRDEFFINDETERKLPVLSLIPDIILSSNIDQYEKKIVNPKGSEHHVAFISINKKAHGFVWKTGSAQIKEAVRWGIIPTQSVTSQAIGALGKYRGIAHARIAKGMISNTHHFKMSFLDLYQDRIEALQVLESLVNTFASMQDHKAAMDAYISKLENIRESLADYITHKKYRDQIAACLDEDIRVTKDYRDALTKDNLEARNQARGKESVLEFVKQQMIFNLYEMQGINENYSFDPEREDIALTRGQINDCILDALDLVDNQQPDMSNCVTPEHHGDFSKHDKVAYNFAADGLSPNGEREVLQAIAAIEGWDEVIVNDNGETCLRSKNEHDLTTQQETLQVIAATRWKNHRNFTAFLQSAGYYVLNMFKSLILPTKPWIEEAWSNKKFRLFAAVLQENAAPHEPVWRKPLYLFSKLGNAALDIFRGVRDFGDQLVSEMPADVYNDWRACDELEHIDVLLARLDKSLLRIKNKENENRQELWRNESIRATLEACQLNHKADKPPTAVLALPPYALSPGEQNDIITAISRGLYRFGSFFSHEIYAKDPIAGLIFTTAYTVGGVAIYLPEATASVLGSTYVTCFSKAGYAMGSSPFAAMVGAGSTQAQLCAWAWDGAMHGTSGMLNSVLYQFGEDPLTYCSYIASAGVLGTVLTNGIFGYKIPWLSEVLVKEEGTIPWLSRPFVGFKGGLAGYELFTTHRERQYDGSLSPQQQGKLLSHLARHAKNYHKLNADELSDLERLIDNTYNKAQAASLKTLLYPPQQHSIAFQLVGIPFSYIPALLRCIMAIPLSITAFIANKPYPQAPIIRAFSTLWTMAKRDLSRLVYAAGHLGAFFYIAIATHIKALIYTVVLLVSRVASMLGMPVAHHIYSFFASIHTACRSLTEFFFPVSWLKDVSVAHPVHTVNEINRNSSYAVLIRELGPTQAATTAPKAAFPDADDVTIVVEPLPYDENQLHSCRVC